MDKPQGTKQFHRQIKAYENMRFLESKDARALRILAEYLEPLARFKRYGVRDTIVFMGSARLVSRQMAEAALAEAEENIGLTISIPNGEFDNPYVSRELHIHFHYFFMRKFWFVYLAKAVVLFPGGFGTLDEFFEMLFHRTDSVDEAYDIITRGLTENALGNPGAEL